MRACTRRPQVSATVSVKRGASLKFGVPPQRHQHHPSRSEQCAAISNQLLSVPIHVISRFVGYPAHDPAPRPTYQCMGRRRVPSAALRAHAPHASLSAAGVAAAATHERHTPGPYARRGQHKPHQPAPAAPAPAPAAAAAAASAAARDAAARASRPSVEQISSTRALVSSKQ